jgi:hypothetical protein
MEKQETPDYAPGQELTLHPGDPVRGAGLLKDQQNEQATDKTWAGPARQPQPASGQSGGPARQPQSPSAQPDGPAPSNQMEVAAEPAPDFRHLPAGGLPQATTYPYPDDEAERALLVAIFADADAADDCAKDLRRQGLEVAVRMLNPGTAAQEAGAQAGQQVPPRRLGGRVALGATLGATAGLLASTFVIPEAGTGVPEILTTILGAGVGSYLGRQSQAQGGEQQAQPAGTDAAQVRRNGVLLVARADEDQADSVRKRIMGWNPVEVRVQ